MRPDRRREDEALLAALAQEPSKAVAEAKRSLDRGLRDAQAVLDDIRAGRAEAHPS